MQANNKLFLMVKTDAFQTFNARLRLKQRTNLICEYELLALIFAVKKA